MITVCPQYARVYMQNILLFTYHVPVCAHITCTYTFFVCSFLLGMFSAAHDLKSEWVVVKGVSRFADSSANKLWETFASVMAASLVSNILSDPFVFEQWPHYGGMYGSVY